MAWRIFAGMAWFASFLLVLPKIAEAMTDESQLQVAVWLVLMLMCLGAAITNFVEEDENGESVVGRLTRRRRPRWRRY